MATHACFVCTDEAPPLYRACACRDSVVHEACLRDVVVRVPAHSERCPVCLTGYVAVRTTSSTVWRVVPHAVLTILYTYTAASWLAYMIVVHWDTAPPHGSSTFWATFVPTLATWFAVGATIGTLVVHAVHVYATRTVCCLRVRATTQRHVAVDPTLLERVTL